MVVNSGYLHGDQDMTPCDYRTRMAERNHCSNTRLRNFPLDLVADTTCERCIWRETEQERRPVPSWFVVGKTLVVVRWAQLFRWGDAVAKVAKTVGIKPATGCGCGQRRERLNRWGAIALRWVQLLPSLIPLSERKAD